MKTIWLKLLFILLLIGLPLGGIWMSGNDLSPYLEFPPLTRYVEHAPFSWPAFVGMALLILTVAGPALFIVVQANLTRSDSSAAPADYTDTAGEPPAPSKRLPWWGWTALALNLLSWLLAWQRFDWMQPLQLYTFNPLWLTYIILINALTYRRTGRCMMTHNTAFFLKLFPLSAAFWWFFEYLNRFVQNWYYEGCEHFTPLQYFLIATLSFSTVLPAVLSTEAWLKSYPRCYAGLQGNGYIKCVHPKSFAAAFLLASSAGLFLIGRFPDLLYPLLWVAPLIFLMTLNRLAGGRSFFSEVWRMDFRRVYRLALAALICGFFWELWNWHSLAKWIYSVPYVHRFQLFEMPLLGYAGYLPFGLECAVIADLLKREKAIQHDSLGQEI